MRIINKMRIFTSLSSTPARQKNLYSSIESIMENQPIKPYLTVLNICESYSRFPSQKIELNNIPKHMNLKINVTNDLGPLTKIYGFLEYYEENLSSDQEDILIIHDDDFIYKNFLVESLTSPIKDGKADSVTHFYGESLDMYQGNMNDISIRSNYVYPNLPGYLGISFKINKNIVKDMKEYINWIIKEIPESKYHDDAIITSYLRTRNNKILWLLKKNEDIVETREDLLFDKTSLSGRKGEIQFRHEISHKMIELLNKKQS